MKYLLRPDRPAFRSRFLPVAVALGFALACGAARSAAAQTGSLAGALEEPNPLLHSGSQPGYLGVLVGDVDAESANKLKLHEVRGAVITLIDHDAPAAQAGLRVNDVVLEVNGQRVEGAEAFGRMLREIPPGRKVTMLLSRDGALETVTAELVDHKKMEHDVWNRLDNGGQPVTSAPGLSILSGGSGDLPSGGFHMPFFGTTTLNVGAMVEPLTTQMAEYLGIRSGLMIKQVARKSEAEAAGLKAFDVILKVGADSIATTADWDRSLRANQNKPVTVTILRDRRQQTVTLQVDSKRHHAELEDLCGDDCPLTAELEAGLAALAGEQFAPSQAEIDPLRAQAEALRKQAEAASRQLQDQLKSQHFGIDPKQMDELKRQLEEMQARGHMV